MIKQTIYLFTRALIIGVLLNMGLQYVSDPLPHQLEAVIYDQVEYASIFTDLE